MFNQEFFQEKSKKVATKINALNFSSKKAVLLLSLCTALQTVACSKGARSKAGNKSLDNSPVENSSSNTSGQNSNGKLPVQPLKTNTQAEIEEEKKVLEKLKGVSTIEFGKLELSDRRFQDVQIYGNEATVENIARFEIPAARKSATGRNLLRTADPISFRMPLKVGELASKNLDVKYGITLESDPSPGTSSALCMFGSLGYKGILNGLENTALANVFDTVLAKPFADNFAFGKTLLEFTANYHDCGAPLSGTIKGHFYTFGSYAGSEEGITQKASFEVEMIAESLSQDVSVETLLDGSGNFSAVVMKNSTNHELLPLEVDAMVQCSDSFGNGFGEVETVFLPRYFSGFQPGNLVRYKIPAFAAGETRQFSIDELRFAIGAHLKLQNCAGGRAILKGFEIRETNGWAPFPSYSMLVPAGTKFSF